MSDLVHRVLAYRMVSLLHKGVIKLAGDRPAFAGRPTRRWAEAQRAAAGRARPVDATLNELARVEFRADAVVVFSRKKSVFIDHQAELDPDKEKRFAVRVVGESR
jgi:hypothetical protein